MASREVKPLDCQANLSSISQKGQEEEGKI